MHTGAADHAYDRYPGSLTTPPCTEGVPWLIMVEPVELSPGQIEPFRSLHHGTNRPVQPLYGRTVLVSQ